ncbi:hypothetical protein Q7P35_005055 [Cladosporium inversicolor]
MKSTATNIERGGQRGWGQGELASDCRETKLAARGERVGEDAGALCKEVAVSFVGGGGVGAVDDGNQLHTAVHTVGSHPATASLTGTRAGDRKVALSLKKLQVSKRSGGRNVARRRSSPRKRAGSIDESFKLPAHSFHSCTLIHGLGVFKVSTGLRVASTRISLEDEATERCPAPPDPACRRRAAALVAAAAAASRRQVGGAGAAVAAADGGVSPPCIGISVHLTDCTSRPCGRKWTPRQSRRRTTGRNEIDLQLAAAVIRFHHSRSEVHDVGRSLRAPAAVSQAIELGCHRCAAVMRQVMWAANVDVARIGVEGFETEPSQTGDE